jgi:bifunctional UDP-N-acetylglucosamine pyrophosphorylase / glucosamine-1-phosphate N-acetyltransferase
MTLNIVIMAAGKGTRMKSALPKVLHRLAHQSLLHHVLDTALALKGDRIITVTGHGAEAVEAAVRTTAPEVRFARQMPQLGTGHAVQQAVPELTGSGADNGVTLILNGDTPLIQASTAKALIEACGGKQLALLTIVMGSEIEAAGLGRIVRNDAGIQAIVEHKDASAAQRAIRETYTGVMAVPTAHLKKWLGQLKNDNAQQEYYLTDIVAMAVADGVTVVAAHPSSDTEVLGVNSPLQLADLERRYQRTRAVALMEAGVRLADPARFDVRGHLECGLDVEIDVNCIFEGCVTLGNNVRIGPNCFIKNAAIGADTIVAAFTHMDGEKLGVKVGVDARIGPFARLRPGADLGDEVHIGNFVEVKNSSMAKGAKANHLAYLGDATVGERVNFGAGSITANYDGVNKHRTVIEADVHVGSNCVLVAPVTLGTGATIGGGSTVTKDAPAAALTVARGKQVTLSGWVRPVKKSG